jgi:hypothetical protein
MAIARRVTRRRAKKCEAEGPDRQAQEAQEEEQQAQQKRNDGVGLESVTKFRDLTPVGPKSDSSWVGQLPGPGAAGPPPLENDVLVAATDTSSVVETDMIRVVVIDVRFGGPGGEAGQPVTRTIARREVQVTRAERETLGDLVSRAEDCLGEEMERAVLAAAGEKVADQILPAQEPTAAAQVVELKSDLLSSMLGQSVPPLAQYVPLPGIDRSLDTAKIAILVGGIVLGTVAPNPGLYSVCVKALVHEAIAHGAEQAIEEAIKAVLSDYTRPPPTVQVNPAPFAAVISVRPPPNKPDVSPRGRRDMSPRGPGAGSPGGRAGPT